MSGEVSKTWFAVLPNPSEHGYAGMPREVCDRLREEWLAYGTTRTGAWAYCISADGLHHVHMILEDTKAMRFSAVKKAYAVGAHIEATMGSKAQAEAYIAKDPPYDEKGEEVVCIVRAGEIRGRQGHRSDIEDIQAMIDAGMTPTEIMRDNFEFRRYKAMIRDAFFDRKLQDTPPERDVTVHYLFGEPGTGKSHTYVELCNEKGKENVYHISDYATGCFDMYEGQAVLFLDEFKGVISFATLLTWLDKYTTQTHARYSNVYMLWSEVYIASVFPPETLYQKIVAFSDRAKDSYEQLARRLTDITYCYVTSDGQHQKYTLPSKDYPGSAAMIAEAQQPNPFI